MDWKQRWQWSRKSLWIIQWMKLLCILSCKSHVEITHPIKALKYVYCKHCDPKAKPLGCCDLDLGVVVSANQSLTHHSQHQLWLPPNSSVCELESKPPLGWCDSSPRPLTLLRHILFGEVSVAHSSVLFLSPDQHCSHWISHCTPSDWASYCFMFHFLCIHDLILISGRSRWHHLYTSFIFSNFQALAQWLV